MYSTVHNSLKDNAYIPNAKILNRFERISGFLVLNDEHVYIKLSFAMENLLNLIKYQIRKESTYIYR